ncbi:Asp/Glu/hydantoin racemase [Cristinia sonorae]|uniref:Asp/Glu/hydantoin racemase n=1 Tax=Cristinia sonorae TaxID=1940300 RepID=A0A8K0UKD6_9AGAR|nr:Asp/Glu/hydantoin racemase [Cristinia sonorae]
MFILERKRPRGEREPNTTPDLMASSTEEHLTILIINPNSSESITAGLRPLLANLTTQHVSLEFFTAPQDAPPSIDDEITSALSTSVTLTALRSVLRSDVERLPPHRYSGYLVACFSPHPLTPRLRTETTVPVLNIFEAALLHAKALAVPFGIVTTGQYWEAVLENGAREFFCGKEGIEAAVGQGGAGERACNLAGFVGVRSTGLTAVQLHMMKEEEVGHKIAEASAYLVERGAEAIVLGCAGMSGMEKAVRAGAQRHQRDVRIIDGVRAGVVLLEGLVKAGSV